MKIEDGRMIRNIDAEIHAYSFMKSYSGKNYSEAIAHLDSIALAGEKDHKLLFNKAICYSYLEETDSVEKSLLEYLQYDEGQNKVPGAIRYSRLYSVIRSNDKLLSVYDEFEKDFCDSLTNCDFAMKIQYCDFKEQEILMDTAFNNGRNTKLKFQLLEQNFEFIKKQLEIDGIPNKGSVGSALGLLGVLILHMDYDPKEQLKWSKKLLEHAITQDGDIGAAVYSVDRSLKNLGKKQKYGSIILNRGTKQSEIYPYEGSFQSLNERRIKLGLKPLKENESSILINE